MIDVRAETIIYQSQIYYRNLVNDLVDKKRLGKALDTKWEKADLILGYLEALNYRDRVTEEEDIALVNNILECLIKLCELNHFPIAAPLTFQEPPAVIVGEKGDTGETGATGATGPTGLATDFQVSLISVPTPVDQFDVNDAKGSRWDYVVTKSTGEQRSGSVIGHWSDDGSSIEYTDFSTGDIVGSTVDLTLDVQLSGTDIVLIATPASGQWTVVGTRYFIPNNGNGTGPISDSLANGTIFIGNSSNVAQSRSVTGVIAITNTGATSFTPGAILNADINASAAIALTKLAALNPNIVPVTDGSGFLTSSGVTATTLSYLDISSSLTGLLNAKLTDPTTTIGDLIIRNNLNNIARLGIGTNGQVLTVVSGVPAWSAASVGLSDPMTTAGDIIIRNASNVTTRLAIGATNQVLTVSGSGVPSWVTPVTSTLVGVTAVAGTTYTILNTDNIVHANNTAARTFTLPAGSSMTIGKIIWVKDSAGTAGTNAITVQRAGSDTFEDGSTSVQIIGDRSALGFYWGDSRWNLI